MANTKIGVTGVTGHFGYQVVRDLLEQGVPKGDIIGLARTPSHAQALAKEGIELRLADFDDPKTLNQALAGIDRALLVSTREPNPTKRTTQHENFIEAAKLNQLSLVVYTSATNPDKSPIGTAHLRTEEFLKKSGIPYLILRNNYYLEVKSGDIQRALNGQPIVTNTGEEKFGLALRSEYALAAANALRQVDKTKQTYDLSADIVSYYEFAKALSQVIGQDVAVQQVNDDQMQQMMEDNGAKPMVAKLMTMVNQTIRNGALDVRSNDFTTLLGRQPKGLTESIQQLLPQINSKVAK